jgi:hypothetical protein
MTMKYLLAVAGVVLATQAQAACDEASIEHISPRGDLIELDDGTEYIIVSGDASGWTEGDDVLVCGDKIVNKSENGESVKVAER